MSDLKEEQLRPELTTEQREELVDHRLTRKEAIERDGYDSMPIEAAAPKSPPILPSTDEEVIAENLSGTNHYTVDQDGLMNNYPVEPEMYFEVPGDAREENEAEKAARAQERREVTQNSLGDPEGEEHVGSHGKGVGII
jgi:hypothetical protein